MASSLDGVSQLSNESTEAVMPCTPTATERPGLFIRLLLDTVYTCYDEILSIVELPPSKGKKSNHSNLRFILGF